MSGVELPLAIAPLILYSIEHYKAIFQPLRTFYRYSEELRDFRDRLRTQKYLFHDSSLALLRKVNGQSLLAKDPLTKRGGSFEDLALKWENGKLDEEDNLEYYLGPRYRHCASVIRVIGRLLRNILEKSKNISEDMRRDATDLRSKLVLSFTKSGLLERLDDLSKRNQEFVAVLQSVNQNEIDTEAHPQVTGGLCIDQFKPVREASFQLFEDITSLLNCDTHTEHAANISLDSDTAIFSESQESRSTRLRFTLALEFMKQQATPTEPICLRIESNMVSESQLPNDIASGKRKKDDDTQTELLKAESKKQRKVRFVIKNAVSAMHRKHCDSRTAACKDGVRAGTMETDWIDDGKMSVVNPGQFCYRPAMHSTVTNLCNQPQLCIHLESSRQLKISHSNTMVCLGFLQRSSNFRHLLYQDSQLMLHAKPMSLGTMLLKASEYGPLGYLSPLERVRLARSLALIVLQFNSTPWLREVWRSRDLQFYHTDVDSIYTLGCRETPKLNVKIPRKLNDSTTASPENLGISKFPWPAKIRNPVLFGLGTIMTELSYQATLLTLRSEEDMRTELELRDFATASRLATNASNPLGTKYGEVARKCVECDFAHGTDLANPRLKDAFQRDVIQELEGIENALKRLYL